MNNEIRRKPQSACKRCAFTGYRLQKMPFGFNESDPACVDFKSRLRDAIESLIGFGYAHFISGGALGMDMFAAEIVLELKKRYPWITLEMVSPFDGQADKWPLRERARREKLFRDADIVTATGHIYNAGCMFVRNRYLVDNADLLLAAYDGLPGGTAMTVEYAQSIGIPVQIIPPKSVSF